MALGIPCRYVISAYDYFEFKEELISVLKGIEELNQKEDIRSIAILAVRMYLAERMEDGNPLGYSKKEDFEFQSMYLSYLANLQIDSLPHWTQEQLEYNN